MHQTGESGVWNPDTQVNVQKLSRLRGSDLQSFLLFFARLVADTLSMFNGRQNVDHIGHMPQAYGLALDWLGNGERTASRLASLIAHFEVSTGLASVPEMADALSGWRDATARIAARRYDDFNPQA